jgi:death-on-curing protein
VRYLTLPELLELHRRLVEQTRGAPGVRDLGRLEAALAQRRMPFDGADLYPSLVEKAVALGFTLIMNHPFVDGNKRIGHAAIDVMLMLNGFELRAAVDDAERMILAVAAGSASRGQLLDWVRRNVVAL